MTERGRAVLGDYIRRRRQELGLTAQEVADRVGVKRHYISGIEGGRIKVPREVLRRKLARVLEVPYEVFLIESGILSPGDLSRDGAGGEADRLLARLPAVDRAELMDMIRQYVRTYERLARLDAPSPSVPAPADDPAPTR